MPMKGFVVAALVSAAAVADGANPFRRADYEPLRRTLRAFYPDECRKVCKDPRQRASVNAIGAELDAAPYWGEKTLATPDGRHDGDRLAQGFSPSEYRCRESATTVLNMEKTCKLT